MSNKFSFLVFLSLLLSSPSSYYHYLSLIITKYLTTLDDNDYYDIGKSNPEKDIEERERRETNERSNRDDDHYI